MKTELQNKAWSVLPKEFKEEVKYEYHRVATKAIKINYDLGFMNAHEGMYGIHNLTSDAEGEEMLMVEKSKVMKLYNKFQRGSTFTCLYAAGVLDTLFGSKCLPDETDKSIQVGDKVVYHPFKSDSFYNAEVMEIRVQGDKPYLLHLEDAENIWAYPIEVQSTAETYPQEPKPAEPKFHKGDKVRTMKVMSKDYVGKVGTINCQDDGGYIVDYDDGSHVWSAESDLEPYTEPKNEDSATLRAESVEESRITSEETHLRNLSQNIANCDKQFDNTLKDSFLKECRLNISATIMTGVLTNPNIIKSRSEFKSISENWLASRSLELADALIAEYDTNKLK